VDNLINAIKPTVFWKEKPLLKKQLSTWSLNNLKKIIDEINNIELLCKKNPQISKVIFFSFFSKICKKANNFS
jgi:DNA polymerase-3 subunit delta